MRLISNTGTDRVLDELHKVLGKGVQLDAATSDWSLFAFAALRDELKALERIRLILPEAQLDCLGLLGGDQDRPLRNQLQAMWLARQCAEWIQKKSEVRAAPSALPQSMIALHGLNGGEEKVVSGHCPFTTEGLGLTPGNRFSMVQAADQKEEAGMLREWFTTIWNALPAHGDAKARMVSTINEIADQKPASLVYFGVLYQLFKDLGEELDEERIMKSATGIRDTVVWRKLFRFQRDAVIGAIDKLERIGGCIIADSVGLGKTFEALAVIKYYELRNDRVLVLSPKRLKENWTVYRTNDKRNVLSADRFNYDVLNHTDLSRESGMSGDIDLSFVNWGNYDLVVIDESHNFRNKSTHRTHVTRYDRLMDQVIKAGVKTKVLMLSATPVNNRLADLKNQVAFITEANDHALQGYGIESIASTVRKAQLQFNRWSQMDDTQRKPADLLDMLGFDYFKLLDLLTIARSRKHIERYYGLDEIGKFPERLSPINVKADVDTAGEFPSIHDVNREIRKLNLSAYAPLRYVIKNHQAYDEKYSVKVRGGESIFRQQDREESLIHLLRVNLLKRMESSVAAFTLSVMHQLNDIESLIAKLDAHDPEVEEVSIDEVDVDDPRYETLLAGRKVKVLLQDVDLLRWRTELIEDRNRLDTLLSAASTVTPERDDKLERLRTLIAGKVRNPINPGNRKIMVFTAFADTANYLYKELSDWAKTELGVETALVTGTGRNRTTLPNLRTDLSSLLMAFSPRSKERPVDLAQEGELDLIIATDCISEGQNLQDCDYLVNYDIHWNPVRIIQRFGRIDRIGSTNDRIQLVNFWPNIELDEYINLEQRVGGRMVLLDVSATGEENIIEQQSTDPMNDLEYRRNQLLQLQERVIDMEDLSSGISITDITLGDFRMDLAAYLRENRDVLDRMPLGTFAVTTAQDGEDGSIPPGVIFLLRTAGKLGTEPLEPGYPLAPHYLLHMGADGAVLLSYTQAKLVLDRLRKLAIGRDLPDQQACARFDKATGQGKDMAAYRALLAKAVAALVGKRDERAVSSLFTPGGTHAIRGEFQGMDDVEVVAYLVVLPEA